MPLSDQIVRDAPEGAFLRTSGASSVNRLSLSALGVGSSMTIAAWVRATTLPAEGVTMDVARLSPTSTTQNQIALSLVTSGGQSFWQWEVSDSTGATTNVQTGTTPVVAGDWYFILGCKNDQFTMRFFVNGLDDVALINSGIAATNNNTRKIYIGRDGRAINDPFDGDIGYVALWDVAISEESVTATYNGGWRDLDLRIPNACYGEASRLVQWWRLGQGAIDGAIAVGDEFVSNWVPSGLTLPDQIGVSQSEIMTPGLGPSGTSAEFGDGDFISTTPALPIGAAGQLSISFWILPTNVTTGTQTILFIGPDGPSTSNAIHLSISADLAGDPFRVDFKSSTGTSMKRNNYDGMLIQDEWQHVLVTLDDTTFEKITVYHNGEEVAGVTEASAGGSNVDSSRFVDIGGSTRGVGTTDDFTGLLGHISIWDSILDQIEAQVLYAQGYCLDTRYNEGKYTSGEPLKHYYKLGEDRVTTGRDFIDTRTGDNVLAATVTTGSVATRGNTPGVLGELGVPALPGELKSVDLDGSTERFLNVTHNAMGLADDWTISFWAKQENAFPLAMTEGILEIGPSIGDVNRIRVTGTDTGEMNIEFWSAGGGNLYSATWFDVFTDNEWNHIVISRDGSNAAPDVYINSSFTMADSTVTAIVGTMSDTARQIEYGGAAGPIDKFSGRVGHLALWSTDLSRETVKEIYPGNHSIDLTSNTGDYTDSTALQHYYRMGYADTGENDEGVGSAGLIHLTDTVDIDETNIILDAPPNAFLPWERSVLMDGSTNYLFGAGDSKIDFANEWTISFWARTANPGDVILDVGPSGSTDSAIFIGTNGDGSISFSSSKTGGAGILYTNSYSDFFDEDEWVHVVAQWDGTEIRFYKNGFEKVGTGFPSDNRPGSMGDDDREISYGALSTGAIFWDGHLGHLTFWDQVLDQTNITAIYCGGLELDHRFDDGDYSMASDLVHYYRPGWVKGSDEPGTRDENLDNVARDHLDSSVIDDGDIANGEVPNVVCQDEDALGVSTVFTTSSDDYLKDGSASSSLGYLHNFTWSVWLKYTASGIASEFPRPMHTEGGTESSISVHFDESEQFTINLYDVFGVLFKQYTGPVETINTWNHYAWTYDAGAGAANALQVYRNGVNITNTTVTKVVDIAGSGRSNEFFVYRFGALGADRWAGKIYSPATWDITLTGAEVAELHSITSVLSYRGDTGDYVSSRNLVNYWDFRVISDRTDDRVGDKNLTLSTVTPADTDVP